MSMPQDEPTANLGPFAILTSSYILCYCYCPPCLASHRLAFWRWRTPTPRADSREESEGRTARAAGGLVVIDCPPCTCMLLLSLLSTMYIVLHSLEKMKSWLKDT